MNKPARARSDPLDRLKHSLRDFARERDWEQFHSPKNLAIALSVEAAELLERFQWLSDDESRALSSDRLAKVEEEIADVLIYLIRMSDQLDIDLEVAALKKIRLNAAKYPPEKARGSNKKYTEL